MKRSRTWAITCYFPFDDPAGSHRRLRAYRQFRKHLQVPVATVELSQDGRFDLEAGDADRLIQVAGGGLLWQKERLLNLALESLPPECDTVLWTDCDVVLAREDWPEALDRELERSAVVQPFERIRYLAETEPRASLNRAPVQEMRFSVVSILKDGRLPAESFGGRGYADQLRYSPGLVWGARRALLDAHGFYDGMILGSGDKALFSAACGQQRDVVEAYLEGPRHRAHFLRWADGFAEAVGGRVGMIEGDTYHFFHGDLSNRGYGSRYEGFAAFDFDPETDLRMGPDGAWEWTGGKPEMEEFVRLMFERRKGAQAA